MDIIAVFPKVRVVYHLWYSPVLTIVHGKAEGLLYCQWLLEQGYEGCTNKNRPDSAL